MEREAWGESVSNIIHSLENLVLEAQTDRLPDLSHSLFNNHEYIELRMFLLGPRS